MKNLSNIMPLKDVIKYSYKEMGYFNDCCNYTEYEKILTDLLSLGMSQDKPVCIHLGGIPGAGKTTFYNNNFWPNHILIQPDGIMEKLSGYQSALKLYGSIEAFNQFEHSARVIAYELLDRAISCKFNIVLDHGGLFEAHVEFLKNLKKIYYYRTEMHFILCDVETAILRSVERQKVINRYISKDVIIERFQKIKKLLPQYQDVVDYLKLWSDSFEQIQ